MVTDPCRRWKEEAKGRRQACGRALGGIGTEGGRRLYDCTLKAKTRCAGMSTQHARIAVDPRREKTAVASVIEESVLISGAVKEVWLEVMVGEKGLVVCGSNVAALKHQNPLGNRLKLPVALDALVLSEQSGTPHHHGSTALHRVVTTVYGT